MGKVVVNILVAPWPPAHVEQTTDMEGLKETSYMRVPERV